MKLNIRYKELDWQIWFVVIISIGVGLAGVREAYIAHAVLSALNLIFYVVKDRGLVSFSAQVREVWLVFALLALWPPLWWLFIALFVGLSMFLLFDRCLIARTLLLMPWNKDVNLS